VALDHLENPFDPCRWVNKSLQYSTTEYLCPHRLGAALTAGMSFTLALELARVFNIALVAEVPESAGCSSTNDRYSMAFGLEDEAQIKLAGCRPPEAG